MPDVVAFAHFHHGITLSNEMQAMVCLPCGDASLQVYTWMHDYFHRRIGDFQPNSNEIHLEQMDKKDPYKEYVEDCTIDGIRPASYELFCLVWRTSFKHVKIREYKSVCGKCQVCSSLSLMRSTFRDRARREMITRLHALHRTAYMGEKVEYYGHRKLAIDEPSKYMCLMADGMAQNHTSLPWDKNLITCNEEIPQHLQGVINHGRRCSIYRSFGNFKGGSNLGIHCTLLELWDMLDKATMKLIHTLFLHFDGGPENANKYVLAIAYLLVARGLCKVVYVIRLPVGHTHEDIDALFSLIWRKLMRNNRR